MPEPDFSAYAGSLPRGSAWATLSSREAFDCVGHGALLVDLREAYETNFRVFDVEDVFFLPMTAFEARWRELPRDRALILADASGIYGKLAAARLAAEGYANLANLAGGMIEWDKDGLPVKRDLAYELNGQCSCKLKTRTGGNPLLDKRG